MYRRPRTRIASFQMLAPFGPSRLYRSDVKLQELLAQKTLFPAQFYPFWRLCHADCRSSRHHVPRPFTRQKSIFTPLEFPLLPGEQAKPAQPNRCPPHTPPTAASIPAASKSCAGDPPLNPDAGKPVVNPPAIPVASPDAACVQATAGITEATNISSAVRQAKFALIRKLNELFFTADMALILPPKRRRWTQPQMIADPRIATDVHNGRTTG